MEISSDASLIIRAPLRIPFIEIQKIVFSKRNWIINKQRIAREKRLQGFPKNFMERDEFLYLGKKYPLVILENAVNPLFFNKEFRIIRNYLPSARELFIDWYKKQAQSKIKERLDFYSDSLGYKYNKFGISNARKRWGSCNSKGNIYINWRLIMAPIDIIDYVIIHELAHLKERSHSKKFWERVKIIQGDYKQRRIWLKENAQLLIMDT